MNAPGDSTPNCGWRARERLGSRKLLFAQVDLGLVPELDPSLAQRLLEIDARGHRRRMAELELLHDAHDGGGVERLLEHRQHLQLVLIADAFHVLEDGRASAAHQLDEAEIAALGQHQDRLDGLAGFQADVEENEIGTALARSLGERLAVAEFFRVDPGPVQDQRQEVADAGVVVNDESQRYAGARVGGGRAVDGGASGRRLAFQDFGHTALAARPRRPAFELNL
jgi:hypothetical protein